MIYKIGTAAAAGLTAALLFAGVAGANVLQAELSVGGLTMVKDTDPCKKTDGATGDGAGGALPAIPEVPNLPGLNSGSSNPNPGAAKQTDPKECDPKKSEAPADPKKKKSESGADSQSNESGQTEPPNGR